MLKLKILFVLSLSCAAIVRAQKPKAKDSRLFIVDIDATLRPTHFNSLTNAIAYLGKTVLALNKPYALMPELLNALHQNPENKIVYLTGTPQLLKAPVSMFLKRNQFPNASSLILKPGLTDSLSEYKVRSILSLIHLQNPSEVVLIGDNNQQDPEVFLTVQSKLPKQRIHSFIHYDKSQDPSELKDTHLYLSALDLAILLNEHFLGLGNKQLESLVHTFRYLLLRSSHSSHSLLLSPEEIKQAFEQQKKKANLKHQGTYEMLQHLLVETQRIKANYPACIRSFMI